MNKNRPVNLDLSTIQFPITAIVSICHRVTGAVLLGGVLVLLWMLDQSLRSQESFDSLVALLENPFAKIVLWGILAALIYHTLAGLKHLIMDMGFGETLEGGRLGAQLTLAASAVLILLAGVWLW